MLVHGVIVLRSRTSHVPLLHLMGFPLTCFFSLSRSPWMGHNEVICWPLILLTSTRNVNKKLRIHSVVTRSLMTMLQSGTSTNLWGTPVVTGCQLSFVCWSQLFEPSNSAWFQSNCPVVTVSKVLWKSRKYPVTSFHPPSQSSHCRKLLGWSSFSIPFCLINFS